MSGEGLLARIFQHETDHLDGMLFIDRLDEEGRKAVLAELRRIELGLAEPRTATPRRRGRRPMPAPVAGGRSWATTPWSVPTLEALADATPTSTSSSW